MIQIAVGHAVCERARACPVAVIETDGSSVPSESVETLGPPLMNARCAACRRFGSCRQKNVKWFALTAQDPRNERLSVH